MVELTDRQVAIKSRLDKGMGAREIAKELGISRNAVYQQIQRLRRSGALSYDFTPTGQPRREIAPGEELLAQLLDGAGTDDELVEVAGALALVQELRQTRDELVVIAQRLSRIVP